MQHSIDTASLGPQGESMGHAIESCVHCGFCLPTCPTYVTMGEEMDSPRGRIFLMKEVLEGGLSSRPRCRSSTTASAASRVRPRARRASTTAG